MMMQRTAALILCTVVAPTTGWAQELTVSSDRIRSCAAETPAYAAEAACAGQEANVCQGLSGGSTTIGIVTCLSAETAVWDAMLNEEYGKARVVFGQIGGDELQVSLRDAQRAWIAFRDAECAMLYQKNIGGTIRSLVSASCKMNMTASRAIALRDLAKNAP
jgi:uncharacterized protein YecT (DUF1311 family)